jgi:hypothetical protein
MSEVISPASLPDALSLPLKPELVPFPSKSRLKSMLRL